MPSGTHGLTGTVCVQMGGKGKPLAEGNVEDAVGRDTAAALFVPVVPAWVQDKGLSTGAFPCHALPQDHNKETSNLG